MKNKNAESDTNSCRSLPLHLPEKDSKDSSKPKNNPAGSGIFPGVENFSVRIQPVQI